MGQRLASPPVPVIPVGASCVDVSEYGREVLGRHHIHLLGGMELGVRALGHALRWLENRGNARYGPARRAPARKVPASPEVPASPRAPASPGGPAPPGVPAPS